MKWGMIGCGAITEIKSTHTYQQVDSNGKPHASTGESALRVNWVRACILATIREHGSGI